MFLYIDATADGLPIQVVLGGVAGTLAMRGNHRAEADDTRTYT